MLAVLLTLVTVMVAFPATPAARYLNRLLVQPCVRRLNRLRPGHAAFTVALIGLGLTLFVLFEAEGLRLFSFLAPEIVAWSVMFDVAVLFEIMVFTATLAATTRLRTLTAQAKAGLDRAVVGIAAVTRMFRQRARRTRPTATAKPRRSDDPDPFGRAYAA